MIVILLVLRVNFTAHSIVLSPTKAVDSTAVYYTERILFALRQCQSGM